MQNLPITISTQPVAPQQTSNPADNNSAQVAETFGSVLARQRANADEPSTDTRDKGQPASSSPATHALDSANTDAAGNDTAASTPDLSSILPGDMLAALLPVPASTSSIVINEKPVPQAPAPDGVSTLPSDMLAALLSTPMIAQQGVSTSTQQQSTVTDVKGSSKQPLIAAREGGQQFAGTGQSIGEQKMTSLFRAPGNVTSAATTKDPQGKIFSTVLETLGKDAALPANTMQTSVQAALPDAITLASLTQSTTSPIVASQNASVQAAINTPVTHDAWGDEFNQKITWLATQHEQTAELHLNPPHLGPLDVVLSVSGDQATALFTSPHAAVREAVEQALPKLREMLADNGIMLGNATVNDQSPKDQQAGQTDKKPGGNASSFGKADDAVPASAAVWPARRHQGMVDTFA